MQALNSESTKEPEEEIEMPSINKNEDSEPLMRDVETGAERAEKPVSRDAPETKFAYMCKMLICFVGLQVSYVTWGVIQEQIMTQPYSFGMFPSSTFLVFANRFLAIIIAFVLVVYSAYKEGKGFNCYPGAPLYMFAPHSLSNVLSSFSQYEALKYVSFPTQVLFKSNKIIPVMLVGKFIHKKSYPWVEYVEALLIGCGVALFMLSEKDAPDEDKTTSLWGIFLLCSYLCCDSFTSQWQDRIYKTYNPVSQFQMMLGTNCMSIFFTASSLLISGEMFKSIGFMFFDSVCFYNIVTLSICSAVGQLFIFYTIKKFGPIIFTIMMTTRQMLSMILSTILFAHPVGILSVVGALVVFCTIGHQIRRKSTKRAATGGGSGGGGGSAASGSGGSR